MLESLIGLAVVLIMATVLANLPGAPGPAPLPATSVPTRPHPAWSAAVIFMQPEGPGACRRAFACRCRIAGGRVAEIRSTADRLGMLTQLGILPDIG